MDKQTLQQLKSSSDKAIFIKCLNEVLDYECDARNNSATTEERKYLALVINSLCDRISNKETIATEPGNSNCE